MVRAAPTASRAKNPGWTSASRRCRSSAASRAMRRRQRARAAASAPGARRRSSPAAGTRPRPTAGSRVRARLTCSANAASVRGSGSSPRKARSQTAASTSASSRSVGIAVLSCSAACAKPGAALLVARERVLEREADQAHDAARASTRRAAARGVEQRERHAVAVVDQRRIAGEPLRRRAAIVSVSGRSPKSQRLRPALLERRPGLLRTTAAPPRRAARAARARSRPLPSSRPGRVDDARR